ncbi:MAG: hypothetical protein RLZZ76_163 [Candidatus Parcubacteria bacterium]|jgi:hypothetical protein
MKRLYHLLTLTALCITFLFPVSVDGSMGFQQPDQSIEYLLIENGRLVEGYRYTELNQPKDNRLTQLTLLQDIQYEDIDTSKDGVYVRGPYSSRTENGPHYIVDLPSVPKLINTDSGVYYEVLSEHKRAHDRATIKFYLSYIILPIGFITFLFFFFYKISNLFSRTLLGSSHLRLTMGRILCISALCTFIGSTISGIAVFNNALFTDNSLLHPLLFLRIFMHPVTNVITLSLMASFMAYILIGMTLLVWSGLSKYIYKDTR